MELFPTWSFIQDPKAEYNVKCPLVLKRHARLFTQSLLKGEPKTPSANPWSLTPLQLMQARVEECCQSLRNLLPAPPQGKQRRMLREPFREMDRSLCLEWCLTLSVEHNRQEASQSCRRLPIMAMRRTAEGAAPSSGAWVGSELLGFSQGLDIYQASRQASIVLEGPCPVGEVTQQKKSV